MYDRFRPYLPRRKGTYRGYVARDDRLFDLTTKRPNYKKGLIRGIRDQVPGRDVCLIGFGRGISSMIAIEAGAQSVTAYEASSEMIEIGMEAFRLNDIPTTDLTVHHALVGTDVDVFGDPSGADHIDPIDLDTKDVLILDCEGAERMILERISDLPEVIVVETHPDKGADTEMVRNLMEEHGYTIEEYAYEPGSEFKSVLLGEKMN